MTDQLSHEAILIISPFLHLITHSGSSELPTYHVWGGGEESVAPSSSYFKLQTEDLDEVWVPKGIKGSKDRHSDDSSSGNSSSNDNYGDSRDSSNCNTRSSSTADLKLNLLIDDDDSNRDKGGKFGGEDPARRHYGSGMSSAMRSKEETQSRIRSNSVQRGNGSGSGSGGGRGGGSGNGGLTDLMYDKKSLPHKDIPEWCNVELNNNESCSNNKDDVSNNNNSDVTEGLDILAPKGLSISTSDEAPHTHYSSIINYRSKLARSE